MERNRQTKLKYWAHRQNSRNRNILFLLTFDQWCNIWEQSGKWEQRGLHRGQYCMSRKGDKGSYEIGNVFIQTQYDNSSQAMMGNTPWNKNTKGLQVAHNKGALLPKYSCIHCNGLFSKGMISRWHNDNCKKAVANGI